jgi:hypothetical protein
MEKIRGQITQPVLIGAGVGLVVGLILGLIIAWGVWPVQWVNAGLSNLRSDLQTDYLVMSIRSFEQDQNIAAAQRRWNEMGDNKTELLAQVAANPPAPLNNASVNAYAAVVKAPVTGQPVATPVPGQTQTTDETTTPKTNTLTIVLVVMCLLTLVIGALLAYLFVFRNRRPGIAGSPRSGPPIVSGRAVEPVGYSGEQEQPPIAQYLTTYNVGNDLYDDSFSIDSPNGEFLGECGVGISETIGVGDPKKVTAFEVWLFDKNDIQTVTKVLMSAHAFNDPTISQRLTSKGEPVLAEPGKHIVLETATLMLEARVVNMNYGQGALPANSFFDQLTLELAIWPKS